MRAQCFIDGGPHDGAGVALAHEEAGESPLRALRVERVQLRGPAHGQFGGAGLLIVVVAGFSYYAYQEEKKPDGVEIQIGKDGLSVHEN